ncbi:hypothetical protein CR513_54522, partial [Mucuna pruriens]
MVFAVRFSQSLLLCKPSSQVKCCSQSQNKAATSHIQTKKRCLRCNTLYSDQDNSPLACSFHGHTNGMQYVNHQGEKGLFSLAPPHQGIDGEWSDKSGVIVYKWNEKNNRPNTGRANWKKRWSCCTEYGENAPPCRLGRHVSYDDDGAIFKVLKQVRNYISLMTSNNVKQVFFLTRQREERGGKKEKKMLGNNNTYSLLCERKMGTMRKRKK